MLRRSATTGAGPTTSSCLGCAVLCTFVASVLMVATVAYLVGQPVVAAPPSGARTLPLPGGHRPTLPPTGSPQNVQSPPDVETVEETAATAALPTIISVVHEYSPECHVSLVGNRPVGTYLCDYFPLARRVPGGCVLACPGGVACKIEQKGTDASLLAADIIVNHHGPIPQHYRENQITLYYSGEADSSEGKKALPAYRSQYDIIVNYRTNRTHHFTWTNRFLKLFEGILTGVAPLPAVDWATRRKGAVVFVSRCGKGKRDALIRAIGAHVKLFSFGKCVKTHSLETEHPECAAKARYDQKMCVFQKYRLAITLDNSPDTDYVTEKVYHGLLSGAVPVYAGSVNVDDFIPSHNSVVHVSDFPTLGELGKYLAGIVNGENAPEKHYAWRSEEGGGERSSWSNAFLAHLRHPEPTCDVCRVAAKRKCPS